MNKETEIKLRASRETLAALRAHPLLSKRNKSGWQRHALANQYYDTAERDLAGARVALRLRRDGEQLIQTLKSRGQSVAGLSERNEWDWYLQQPELDLGLLDDRYKLDINGMPDGSIVDDLAPRMSAGLSVHWRSPMGPIRFDFSQLILREDYDRTETFRFSTSTQF